MKILNFGSCKAVPFRDVHFLAAFLHISHQNIPKDVRPQLAIVATGSFIRRYGEYIEDGTALEGGYANTEGRFSCVP